VRQHEVYAIADDLRLSQSLVTAEVNAGLPVVIPGSRLAYGKLKKE